MVGNKGFIHIIEAVLISVVAIALVPALLQNANPKEEWGRTKLRVMGRDILATLAKRGVPENITSYNRSETIDLIGGILGQKRQFIQYNLKTEGSYRKSIRVGFNCTGCDPQEEINNTEEVLSPVWLNGRLIRFRVFPFKWKNFTGRGKNYDLDVIFINDEYLNEAKNHRNKIIKHLSHGGGVVEYADVSGGGFQKEIFGIRSGAGGGEMSFTNRENTSKLNYGPSKLFYGVGSTVEISSGNGEWTMRGDKYDVTVDDLGDEYNVTVENSTGYELCSDCKEGDDFLIKGYNFTVEKVKEFNSRDTVWFRHLEKYKFKDFSSSNVKPSGGEWSRSVLDSGTDESGFIVNKSEGGGRTAWVANGNGDDIEGLVQSAAIWASERGSWNFLRSPGSNSVQVSRFVANNKEVYEPYLVVLSLWYIY